MELQDPVMSSSYGKGMPEHTHTGRHRYRGGRQLILTEVHNCLSQVTGDDFGMGFHAN